MRINIPDLGSFSEDCGLKRLAKCSDGRFEAGKDGVTGIYATGDGKVVCLMIHIQKLSLRTLVPSRSIRTAFTGPLGVTGFSG